MEASRLSDRAAHFGRERGSSSTRRLESTQLILGKAPNGRLSSKRRRDPPTARAAAPRDDRQTISTRVGSVLMQLSPSSPTALSYASVPFCIHHLHGADGVCIRSRRLPLRTSSEGVNGDWVVPQTSHRESWTIVLFGPDIRLLLHTTSSAIPRLFP